MTSAQKSNLNDALEYCRQVTQARAKNFYHGLKLTPEPKRSAQYAIYAWMRKVDDLVDHADESNSLLREKIDRFRVATDAALDGKITVLCECDATDEEIELILDTTAAHHFNFVAANLSSGVHTIDVKAEIVSATTSADADASAIVGPGSLTVEEVRATNSPDGIDLQ